MDKAQLRSIALRPSSFQHTRLLIAFKIMNGNTAELWTSYGLNKQETLKMISSLFIPRSEEDLVRSITSLSNELKYIQDQPQVLISFQEQRSDRLTFNIVLLRVLKPESVSLQEASAHLPSTIRFIPKQVAVVGTLRDKYHKEANTFALEVDNRLFLRENHSVDLIKARTHVVEALETMIGPFKDCSSHFLPPAPSKEAIEAIGQPLQVLHLQLPRAAQSLDPRAGADRTSGIVIRMLYEGLCRITPQGNVEPAIAHEIRLSEDKKTYLFTLKETYWSNGSPLTAYDFEYAWKKILEPDFHSPYSFLYFAIKNAEAVKQGNLPLSQVGIRVLNDRMLEVTLEYPAPYFLELLASWLFSPLCREIDQKHPGWAYHSGITHVCNGPFKLDVWKHSDELQLVKNPLYWDAESVKLEQIHISIVEEEKKALDLFYRSEFDWVGDPLSKIPTQDAPSLKERSPLHTDPNNYGLFWLQMNMHTLPFRNAKIRKAFAYGVNRQQLIDTVLHSQDTPAFGFATTKEAIHPPLFQDGDQQQAIRLFKEGLEELNLSVKDLPPIVFTHSEIEEQGAISQALAKQWQDLFGIQVTFKRVLWNAYFEMLQRNDYMIGGLVWYTRFTDPTYFYDLFILRPYALKVTTWKNPLFEQYVAEAKQTLDPAKKQNLLFEAEKLLLEAMPAIPLFYQHFRYVKNPRLKGFIISNANQIDFRTAYLDNATTTDGSCIRSSLHSL